jgi:hypothetical protein
MWVQLAVPQSIRLHGKNVHYNIGDWVEIPNNKEAMRMIANNQARPLPTEDLSLTEDGLGVVSPYDIAFPYDVNFTHHPKVEPLYEKTVFISRAKDINKQVKLVRNPARLWQIFNLLETWDLVLFLGAFKENALDVAKNEHERTKGIVGDLRVKFYSSDVFAMRDTTANRKFCEILTSELGHGKELASLRALFSTMKWSKQTKTYFRPYYLGRDWI